LLEGPLSPCRQQVVWGAAALALWPQIPRVGGWRFSGHLTISDDYWIILDALLFLTTSPGKAGLPG
jgi:hypothetical protein